MANHQIYPIVTKSCSVNYFMPKCILNC